MEWVAFNMPLTNTCQNSRFSTLNMTCNIQADFTYAFLSVYFYIRMMIRDLKGCKSQLAKYILN